MLVWPLLTALGFAALTAVVIVLGIGSTARYEGERQQAMPQSSAVTATSSR